MIPDTRFFPAEYCCSVLFGGPQAQALFLLPLPSELIQTLVWFARQIIPGCICCSLVGSRLRCLARCSVKTPSWMMKTQSESRASGKGTISSVHFSAEFLNVWPRERPSLYLTGLGQSHEGQQKQGSREGPWVPCTEKGAVPNLLKSW